MAQTLAELYVKIGSDFQKVDGDLSKLDHRIKGMDPSIQKMESGFSKVNKTIGALGGVIAGIGIVKFGSDIFQASLKMENLNKMLLANEGSQKKANDAMAKYLQMAKSPALSLPQVAMGMTQLKNLGASAGTAEKLMMALGNQMALSGRGAEEFGHVMLQIQQSLGKTSIMAQDLNVIAESLPTMRRMIAQTFGTADTEKIAKMGMTTLEFWTKLTATMEKSPQAIGGTQNAIDNFKDSLLQFEASLGKVVMPAVGRFLDSLTKLMDQFNAMPEATKNVIGKAVVGGAGLLGIAATLTSIVSTIGLVKAGLSGLGAVNVAGGVAKGAGVASGVTSGAVAGAVAKQGFTIGTALMTIGKLSIVAGTVAMAYSVADKLKNSGVAVIGDTQASKDWFNQQTGGGTSFNDIARDYNRNVATNQAISKNKYTSNMFVPAGFGKTSSIIPTPEQAEKLKKEAEKASEIYWTNWFDHAEAGAKQEYQINTFTPNIFAGGDRVVPSGAVGTAIRKDIIDSPSIPFRAMTDAADVERKGLTSGLGLGTEVSKAMQEEIKSKEKIYQIEKDSQKEMQKIVDGWKVGLPELKKLDAEWNDLFETQEKAGKYSYIYSSLWTTSVDTLVNTTGTSFDKLFGGTTTSWKDLMSDMLKEWSKMLAKKLLYYGAEKLGEWAIDKATKKEDIPNWEGYQNIDGTMGKPSGGKITDFKAAGWGHGYDPGSVWDKLFTPDSAEDKAWKAGHVGEFASGGWIMKPTIALMGEREPELVIPKSKMGSSGFGGNTHIEIHNINVPTMDRQAAENLVIQAVTDAKRHARI